MLTGDIRSKVDALWNAFWSGGIANPIEVIEQITKQLNKLVNVLKIVELDHACRQQQVNDGCFPNLDAVPRHAFSLTVSIFRRARRLSLHVPGPRKAAAVQATIEGPITTACPASILRLHPEATLFVDRASAQLLRA